MDVFLLAETEWISTLKCPFNLGEQGLVVLSFNIDIFSADVRTEWNSKISIALVKGDKYRDHIMFFHLLTFAGSQGSCLKTRPVGLMFKNHPRGLASVNAMKQTCDCVILILHFWSYSNQVVTENTALTLNIPFLSLDFLKNNEVNCKL